MTEIRIKRGPASRLPVDAADGEPLLTTDTHDIYVGGGPGVMPVKVTGVTYEVQAALAMKANAVDLGTAAAKDVPATGNASAGQVVMGNDTRLSNSRTPTTHKASHAVGGSDILTPADIGLGNVDNTADADKPVSMATQTALDAKANTNSLPWVAYTSGDISNAAASAIADSKPLLIPKQVNITTNTDLSAVPEIRLVYGGSFNISAGVTLTLPTNFQSGKTQIFYGSGSVSGLQSAYPEWFNGDLQRTVNAGKRVVIDGAVTVPVTTSITVPDNTTIIIGPSGSVSLTTATVNGLVLGANCRLIGQGGKIISPATWDGANVAWTYAVVYVTGSGTSINGVILENVPKVGFGFRNVNDGAVTNCTITGNFPSGSWTGTQTAHYGISIDPVNTEPQGDFKITGNTIKSCVQGVFIGNYGTYAEGRGIIISGNTLTNCLNHGVYSNGGMGVIVSGNTFNYCALPVAMLGSYHKVIGNVMLHGTGGGANSLTETSISMREASHCDVSHNTIRGDAPISGTVIDIYNLPLDPAPHNNVDNNRVSFNTIELTGGSSIAIRVGSAADTDTNINNIIEGNIVSGSRRVNNGVITVQNKPTAQGSGNIIRGNTISVPDGTGDIYGIYAPNQDGCIISGNSITGTLSATLVIGIKTSLGNDNIIHNNKFLDVGRALDVRTSTATDIEINFFKNCATQLYTDDSAQIVKQYIVPPSDISGKQTTAGVDLPIIAAGAQYITNSTCVGATLGDLVLISLSGDSLGLVITGWVYSTNNVHISFYNPTASAINLGAMTLNVRAITP